MTQRLQAFRSRRAADLLSRLLAIFAFILLVDTINRFLPTGYYYDPTLPTLIGLVGCIWLLLALWLKSPFSEPEKFLVKSTRYPIRWEMVGAGIAIITVLVQINIMVPIRDPLSPFLFLMNISHHAQFALFVAACSMMVWGFSGERDWWLRLKCALRAGLNPRRWTRYQCLLLAIVIVAIVARVWNLEWAIRRFLDELHYARAVSAIRDDNIYILQPFSLLTAFSWIFPYIQSWVVQFTGPNLFALRIVGVAFGVAQVIVIYRLGALLYNREVGLIAALILATLPVHVHFSRIGIANIADPLFGILTFYFLALGLRSQRPLHYSLAGLCLGLTSYFYEGGRLFFLPFVICWLGWLMIFARTNPNFRFPSRRNLFALCSICFVLLFTLYFTWIAGDFDLVPRLNEMGRSTDYWQVILGDESNFVIALANQLREPFMLLIQTPDTSWFYGGNSALILPQIAPFFLYGLVITIWRIRKVDGSLLFWWIFAALVGNMLIQDRQSAPRYLVLAPALALVIAVGIYGLIAFILRHRLRFVRVLLLMSIAIGFAYIQLRYYFETHLPNFYMQSVYELRLADGRLAGDIDDVMMRAVQLPDNTIVHIVYELTIWQFNMQTVIEYFGREGEISIRQAYTKEFNKDYIESLDMTRNHAFFMDQNDSKSFNLINENLNISQPFFSFQDIPPEKQMVMYIVLAGNGL